MGSALRELVTVDRSRVDVRAGLVGLAAVAVLALLVIAVGPQALAAVIGALVVLVTAPSDSGRARLGTLVGLVTVGSLLTWVAVLVGERAAAAALLMGAVGVAGALQAGRSERADTRNLVATLWLVTAFTLHGSSASPWEYAVAFAVGGALGIAVAALRSRRTDPAAADEPTVADDDDPDLPPEHPTSVGELISGPSGAFALLRGLGAAVAVYVGITVFPEHPAWVAVTALIVMRPPASRALAVGVQRSLGTAVGILVAVAFASVVGDNRVGLVLLFLASAFLMMAFREANYALFASFVTALVIYSQRILGVDAAESGRDRLLETLIGVVIAFVVLGVAEATARRATTQP